MSSQNKTQYHQEILTHFNCQHCKKWWSIGDAPDQKQEWHCPWCGQKQMINLSAEEVELSNEQNNK